MTAYELVITERTRSDPLAIANPADFKFSVGPEIDPQVIVTNPRVSLYCLDHANRRALFVETAPGVDLSQAPFFYQAQYENTVNLIGVPYETLHQLAREIVLDNRRLILLYSIGRTGSTLLGAALNAVEGVVGISEPDAFTQLVALREWDGSNQAEISALVETCLKLQCKPTEQIPNPTAWAVKFRSFCIELGDLFYTHFPNSKNIFLYRNAETWMESMMRAFATNEDDSEFRAGAQNWLGTLVPPIAQAQQNGTVALTIPSMVAMMWVRDLEYFMELNANGMPGLPVRYEDLQTAPHETLQMIYAYCGLSMPSKEQVDQVLEKDSQAGSTLSHEYLGNKKFALQDKHKAELAKVLRAHPIVNSPDFVVPIK